MKRPGAIDRILSTIGDALAEYDRNRVAAYRVVFSDTAPRTYYATSAVDALRIARADIAPMQYVLNVARVERTGETVKT